MYKLFLVIVFFVLNIYYVSAQNKIYFDASWKKTTKENASFYRIIEKKEGYYQVLDYYISGTVQFSGKSGTSAEPFVLDGIARWYYENGKVQSEGNYINNKLNGEAITFYSDGQIKTKRFYKNDSLTGTLTEYYPWGEVKMTAGYQNSRLHGNIKGTRLYETRDYSASDCSDKYLQSAKATFDPYFFLSDRFSVANVLDDKGCKAPVVEKISQGTEIYNSYAHPIYYSKKKMNDSTAKSKVKFTRMTNDSASSGTTGTIEGKLTEEIDYKDPANKETFLTKNNCNESSRPNYPPLFICTRNFGKLIFTVYTSENTEELMKLKSSILPKPNEVYFFYQRYEEKKYPANTKTKNRMMLWKISDTFKMAINEKIIDSSELINIIENEFFEADSFSGISAHLALNKEL